MSGSLNSSKYRVFPRVSNSPRLRRELNKLRLFIVDDSELMCARLSQMLQEIKNTEIVGVALNAHDAWPSIKKTNPDLTILDIHLAGDNGIDILKQIRKAGLPMKVAIYTHYPYPQYRKRCLSLGADFFFDKYNDYAKLTAVIGKMTRAKNREAGPSGENPTRPNK